MVGYTREQRAIQIGRNMADQAESLLRKLRGQVEAMAEGQPFDREAVRENWDLLALLIIEYRQHADRVFPRILWNPPTYDKVDPPKPDSRQHKNREATSIAMKSSAAERTCPACGRRGACRRLLLKPRGLRYECRYCDHSHETQ